MTSPVTTPEITGPPPTDPRVDADHTAAPLQGSHLGQLYYYTIKPRNQVKS